MASLAGARGYWVAAVRDAISLVETPKAVSADVLYSPTMTAHGRALSSSGGHRDLLIAVAAVLTPVVYLGYVVLLREFQGYSQVVERPAFTQEFVLFGVVLGETGALAVVAWTAGLRIPPVVGAVTALGTPWLYVGPTVDPGYASLPFVAVLMTGGIEATVRYRGRVAVVARSRTGRDALAAGGLHFLFGLGLQVATRGFYWLEYSVPSVLIMGVIYVVSGVVLVVVGAGAVVCWRRYRLRLPAMATVGWFLWGVAESWQRRSALPLGSFTGTSWGEFEPHPDYLLKWSWLLVVFVAAVGGEVMVRRIVRRLRSTE